MSAVDYLILGHGYTAQFLSQTIKNPEPDAQQVSTSRSDSNFHYFDLEDPEIWDQLPQAKVTFWTFPPSPLDLVKNFYNENKSKLGKLVVIGSTSAFKTESPHQDVDEQTPFDTSVERAEAEEFLKNNGAVLVMSSGIYGPNNNPVNWVTNGYVGKSEKFVNMIHVEDLAQFTFNAGLYGEMGNVYIASDNCPLRWVDVITAWEKAGLVSDVPEKTSKRASKKINSSKSIEALKVQLKYQNFQEVVLNESR